MSRTAVGNPSFIVTCLSKRTFARLCRQPGNNVHEITQENYIAKDISEEIDNGWVIYKWCRSGIMVGMATRANSNHIDGSGIGC